MKIDKNIEFPNHWRKNGDINKYPFGEMVVGDSFFVNVWPKDKPFTYASQWSIRYGGKFVTRRIGKGVRVWKMA